MSLPSKHSKPSLIPVLLLLLLLAGGVFYLKPLYDEVSRLQTGIITKRAEKSELEKKIADLKALQQNIEQGSEVVTQTSAAAIPEKMDQDKLLADLSALSLKNDVIMNSVNFSQPVEAKNSSLQRVSVNANFSGTQGSLINLLKGIEGNSRKLVVKSISVQSGSAQLLNARVYFTVSMVTYFSSPQVS